jgi:hypothetical protein
MSFYDELKARLDEVHTWPSLYLFKFIVPIAKKDELLAILPMGLLEQKLSRTGKYIALSLKVMVKNTEEIIALYQRAETIEGIVSL